MQWGQFENNYADLNRKCDLKIHDGLPTMMMQLQNHYILSIRKREVCRNISSAFVIFMANDIVSAYTHPHLSIHSPALANVYLHACCCMCLYLPNKTNGKSNQYKMCKQKEMDDSKSLTCTIANIHACNTVAIQGEWSVGCPGYSRSKIVTFVCVLQYSINTFCLSQSMFAMENFEKANTLWWMGHRGFRVTDLLFSAKLRWMS